MGSQFPDQGSNPRPPALEARSLNHWTAREVPIYSFCNEYIILCLKKEPALEKHSLSKDGERRVRLTQ